MEAIDDSDGRQGLSARRVAGLLGGFALVGGAVTLLGWQLDLPRLTDWYANNISMQPNTAVAAVVAGVALLLLSRNLRRWAALLGALVALIGGATLFEHLTGISLGIDTLLFHKTWGGGATVTPGRMGPPASVAYLLLGIGLVLPAGGPRARAVAAGLGLTAAGMALLTWIGYLFGASPLYTVPHLTGIAFQTSTILLALGAGLSLALPDRQPVRTLIEPRSGAGLLSRRALPFVFALPLVLGWLRIKGEQAGLYDQGLGTALLVLLLIVFLCVVLWYGVDAVRGRERALATVRDQLAADLSGMNRLHDLGRLCARSDADLDECLGSAIETAMAVTDADMGDIQLLDSSGALRLRAQRGFERPFVEHFALVRDESTACGAAQRAGERVVVEDVRRSEIFAGRPSLEVMLEAGAIAVQSTPLVDSTNRCLGMISTHFRRPHQPSEHQLRRLDLLARQLADFLERKQTEDALRGSERIQRLLARMGELAARSLDADELLDRLVGAVAEELGARRCGYSRVDWVAGEILVEHDYHGELPSLKGRFAFRDSVGHFLDDANAGRVTQITDARVDPRTAGRYERGFAGLAIRAYVAVPLRRDGRWDGGLWVAEPEPRAWREDEIELLRVAAERIRILSDHARIAEALRESEERLRLALDAAQLGIFQYDFGSRRLTANRRYAALFGLDGDEPLTFDLVTARIHPADRPLVDAAWERSLTRRHRTDMEYRVLSDDGGFRWIRSVGRATLDERDQPEQFIGVVMEVTERKRAEEALRESDRRKDEFLATLAHELRNPLAPLANALEIIKRSADRPAVLEQSRVMMERQLSHIVRLVDDLLDVSRISRDRLELKKERVDLNRIARDAVDGCRSAIDAAGQELTVDLVSDPVWLHADPVRLVQVLSNLLANASKFTGPGGRIRLEVSRRSGEAAATVSDTGIGIAAAELPRVFDLFTQIDATPGHHAAGLGIGLALVKRLVEMHGGSVSAESGGPGRGSRFRVTLPTAESIADPAPAAAPSEPPSLSSRRILVVDDNRDAAASLGLLLETLGGEAEVAYDGEEALAKVRERRPDLVLLDIGLPGMSGHEVCRALRTEMPNGKTVIVAVTGWGQEQDRRRSREAGFDAHLVKPVTPADLLTLLAALPSARRD